MLRLKKYKFCFIGSRVVEEIGEWRGPYMFLPFSYMSTPVPTYVLQLPYLIPTLFTPVPTFPYMFLQLFLLVPSIAPTMLPRWFLRFSCIFLLPLELPIRLYLLYLLYLQYLLYLPCYALVKNSKKCELQQQNVVTSRKKKRSSNNVANA